MEATFEMQCNDCEAQFNREDAEGPRYECGRCGAEFGRADSADDSSRCPNCNVFSAKVGDYSCPECQGGDLEEGEFSPPPPPTEEELKVRAAQREKNRQWQERYDAEYAKKRAAVEHRWAEEGDNLAAVWATVDPELPEALRRSFLHYESSTHMLDTTAMEAYARLVLRLPPHTVAERAEDGYEDYRVKRERWERDELVRAFVGTALMQFHFFYDGIATSVDEKDMVVLTERLQAVAS